MTTTSEQKKEIEQKAKEILIENDVLIDELELLVLNTYPRGERLKETIKKPAYALWQTPDETFVSVFGFGFFKVITKED